MRDKVVKIVEAVDVKKIISDLKKNFSGSNNDQMKGIQLLKGLATSDDDLANKFMKELDQATTNIANRLVKEERVMHVVEENIIEEIEDPIKWGLEQLGLRRHRTNVVGIYGDENYSVVVFRIPRGFPEYFAIEVNEQNPQVWENASWHLLQQDIEIDTGIDINQPKIKKEKAMRKVKENREIIEIPEEVRIPGTNVILEKGDKIEVLNEMNGWEASKLDAKGEYYAEYDEDVGEWCVFGTESGFCYATFMSQRQAEDYADEMNSR